MAELGRAPDLVRRPMFTEQVAHVYTTPTTIPGECWGPRGEGLTPGPPAAQPQIQQGICFPGQALGSQEFKAAPK